MPTMPRCRLPSICPHQGRTRPPMTVASEASDVAFSQVRGRFRQSTANDRTSRLRSAATGEFVSLNDLSRRQIRSSGRCETSDTFGDTFEPDTAVRRASNRVVMAPSEGCSERESAVSVPSDHSPSTRLGRQFDSDRRLRRPQGPETLGASPVPGRLGRQIRPADRRQRTKHAPGSLLSLA